MNVERSASSGLSWTWANAMAVALAHAWWGRALSRGDAPIDAAMVLLEYERLRTISSSSDQSWSPSLEPTDPTTLAVALANVWWGGKRNGDAPFDAGRVAEEYDQLRGFEIGQS
jgi:hypothetical protein